LSDEIPIYTPVRTKTSAYRRRILASSTSDSENENDSPSDHGSNKQRQKKQKKSRPSAGEANVLQELKKSNAIMADLAKKVKATERRVRAMEAEMMNKNSSPSGSTPKRRKRDVPDAVRVIK
jgi:septin family protein